MPIKPDPDNPDLMVYVKREYNLPKKEWVDLTDDEILDMFDVSRALESDRNVNILLSDARKLLDAVKEKNT